MLQKRFGTFGLTAALFLTGCGSQEIFRPFDIDQTSLSSDARQRVILSAVRGPEGETRRVVCAEPSPDAATALAASLGANLSGELPRMAGGAPLTPQADLAFRYAMAEQVAYIGVRNSTIQLLRDGLYRACEAYMNGAIGDFGYSLILANYGRLMVSLLMTEGLTRPSYTGATLLLSEAGSTGDAGGSAQPATLDVSAKGKGDSRAGEAQGAGAVGTKSVATLEDIVLELADPHRNPQKSVTDITVACFMWAEETPMRAPKSQSPKIQAFCNKIFEAVPGQMQAVLDNAIRNGTSTATQPVGFKTAR